MRASDFGLVWVNSAESLSDNARIQRGVSTGARLDRFPLYWNEIEAQAGQFQWGGQDKALLADEAQGLAVLPILLGEPAAYYPTGAPVVTLPRVGGSFLRYGPGAGAQGAQQPRVTQSCGPPAPRDLNQPPFADGTWLPGPGKAVSQSNPWGYFVDQVVKRYGPGGILTQLPVRQWEIWNEPDLCEFWSGTPQQYALLLKVAYLVIKNDDPGATVVWGGLAHYEQPNFLAELLEALSADPLAGQFGGFFDAAAGHQYSIVSNGYYWTLDEHAALQQMGWGAKPIWITESGVPVCNDFPGPSCPSPYRATPEEQASYIWQNLAYSRMAGGGPVFQFDLFDDCGNVVAKNSPDGFGLVKNEPTSYCSPDSSTARLSYSAYSLAVRYFAGAELLWFDVDPATTPRVRRVAFYDPVAHERRTLLWALDNAVSATVSLPAVGTEAREIALDGAETLLAPVAGAYTLTLPAPTNRNWPDASTPGGYDTGIYGRPDLLIEQDTLPPSATVAALPITSSAQFSVTWQATDFGSGVARVALFYQQDGGPWQLWWSGLPAGDSVTSATGTQIFQGEPGHGYQFGVLATDRAGNTPAAPVGQAQTAVYSPASSPGNALRSSFRRTMSFSESVPSTSPFSTTTAVRALR
jgi:hypothetical protein